MLPRPPAIILPEHEAKGDGALGAIEFLDHLERRACKLGDHAVRDAPGLYIGDKAVTCTVEALLVADVEGLSIYRTIYMTCLIASSVRDKSFAFYDLADQRL